MTSKKPGDLLERMRATATGPASALPDGESAAPLPPPASARRRAERRIRYTLDLSPDQHRFLKRFALEAGVEASTVARTLLSVLENDESLGARVRDRVLSLY